MVLRDDDALAVGAGGDLDEDSARRAVGIGGGEGMVVEGVLDGGEGGAGLVAGGGGRCGGINADVDVGRKSYGGEGWDGEKEQSEGDSVHADEVTSRAVHRAIAEGRGMVR